MHKSDKHGSSGHLIVVADSLCDGPGLSVPSLKHSGFRMWRRLSERLFEARSAFSQVVLLPILIDKRHDAENSDNSSNCCSGGSDDEVRWNRQSPGDNGDNGSSSDIECSEFEQSQFECGCSSWAIEASIAVSPSSCRLPCPIPPSSCPT